MLFFVCNIFFLNCVSNINIFFFFQAEDGIRDHCVTGVQTCALPISAFKALEKFWTKLEKLLPSTLDDGTTCTIQKAARQYRAQLRVVGKKLDRPATIADLLGTWKCESKIVQKCWAETPAEKKKFKELIEPLHEKF